MINDTRITSKKCDKIEKVIITFHGYGTSGADFAEVGDIFLSKKIDNAVFIFPDAPYKCNNGLFDVTGFEWFPLEGEITECNLRKGIDKVSKLVESYINDIVLQYYPKELVIIGFSQGAMIALETLYFNHASKIIAFSGIFSERKDKSCFKNSRVLLIHSEDDHVVPYKYATEAKNKLDDIVIDTRLVTYKDIGHTISIEAWQQAIDFINK